MSSTLSLGYDFHHEVIRPLLKKAGTDTGLSDPFLHILELGNFSVTYPVSGLLSEVKSLLTMRSNLNAHILDCMHDKGIEIMSPAFTNQRRLPEDYRAIAREHFGRTRDERNVAENIVFDKAEEVEQHELQQAALLAEREAPQHRLAEATEKEEKTVIQTTITAINGQLEALEKPRQE